MVSEIHEPGDYCASRRDEIVDYVFAEMGPGAAEAFEAHLASCPGCTREVAGLRGTVEIIEEAAPASAGAEASANGGSGSAVSLEEEWALLRRRLRFPEALAPEPAAVSRFPRLRAWVPAAAAVVLTALLSFTAGWLSRGPAVGPETASTLEEKDAENGAAPEPGSNPPLSEASVGNYFDHLEDFNRDTHSCLRRTRMILLEFTKLGPDSDPAFFRDAAGDLRAEIDRYQAIATRMESRKLGELLDQISAVLGTIASIDAGNQRQVISDVHLTLEGTQLLARLELLDAALERGLEGPPNV